MRFHAIALVSLLLLSGDILHPNQPDSNGHVRGVQGFITVPSTRSRQCPDVTTTTTTTTTLASSAIEEAVVSSVLPPARPPPEKHGKQRQRQQQQQQVSHPKGSSSNKAAIVNNDEQKWNGKAIPEQLPKLSDLMKAGGLEIPAIGGLVDNNETEEGTDGNAAMLQNKGEGTHTIKPTIDRNGQQKGETNGITSNDQQEPKKRNPKSPLRTERPSVAVVGEPWKAGYMASTKTQKRIQEAVKKYPRGTPSMKKATAVLETLLTTLPERCNEANVICALTLSAKVMMGAAPTKSSRGSNSHGNTNSDGSGGYRQFRSYLIETLDILHEMVEAERLSMRQLCNAAWAIGKHYNRDETLLPPPPSAAAASADGVTVLGVAETWVLENETKQSAEQRLDDTVDNIARQILAKLLQSIRRPDDNNNSRDDNENRRKVTQRPKVGEIAMACWAYGIFRPRKIPPGWIVPRRLGQLPQDKQQQQSSRTVEFITFEQWAEDDAEDDALNEEESCTLDATDKLFDAVGQVLCEQQEPSAEQIKVDPSKKSYSLLELCTWSELANIAWACAHHGYCQTPGSEKLMVHLAREASYRLNGGEDGNVSHVLPRDAAQLVWAMGTLQTDNFRLGTDLVNLVDAVAGHWLLESQSDTTNDSSDPNSYRPLWRWSCADLVQLAISMAHTRIDHPPLLNAIFEEALARLDSDPLPDLSIPTPDFERRTFRSWEVSVLFWAQARLNLRAAQGNIFEDFAATAPKHLLSSLLVCNDPSLGAQEQANIAWSMTVLGQYQSPESIKLLQTIFQESARASKKHNMIQLEHAHQLWQTLFLLEEECPEAIQSVPKWFYDFLQQKWTAEKARRKLSSARHKSLSQTLNLMGIAHFNEHDEDIDVAIILKHETFWTSSAAKTDHNSARLKVAVEFDGPSHFTREDQIGGGSRWSDKPRALGHTALKYRSLKKQGWTVVRVPYFEFDKIPFWASMERQRYLQRLLKTDLNIHFSTVDISEYKAPNPNRASRFD